MDRVVGPATPPVPVPPGLDPVGDGDEPPRVFMVPCPGRTVEVMRVDVPTDAVPEVPAAGAVVSASSVGTGDSAPVVSVAPALVLPPGVMGGKGRMLTSPVASSVGAAVSAGVSSVGIVVVSAGDGSAVVVSPVGGANVGVVSAAGGTSTVGEDSPGGGVGFSTEVDSGGGDAGVPAGEDSVGGGDWDDGGGATVSFVA